MNLVTIPLGMIDRPTAALRAAGERPRSWWLPALLLVLSMVVLTLATAPYAVSLANERTQQTIEQVTARMPPEQAAQVRQNSRPVTFQSYVLMGVGAAVLLGALSWIARGAFAHFGSMATGGQSAWGPTFAVVAWSMLPFFVRDLLQAVFVFTQKRLIEHPGLSFLVASGNWLQDGRNLSYAALGKVDLFALWHIVLLGIGISVVTRLSRRGSIVLSVVIWLVMLGLSLIPVLLGRALGGNVG